ncbi:MAG: hypothetical protein QE271_12915 [Bacteriovoracaceae bacterium]|nr:hypothetical protein [Bacteriovoracaceae bacterium]
MANLLNENSIKPKNFVEDLESMSHNAGKKIGAMANDVVSMASDQMNSGRAYVRENPATGIAIAAAAGAVAGSLITMIMRNNK